MNEPILRLKAITKAYDGAPLLRGLTLDVQAGEVVCLLGPSGCGKSTLLRIIAGIEQQEAGEVWFDGQRLDGQPAHARNFGLMFQDGALFPHLSVIDNIAFGLRMRGAPAGEALPRARALLAQVGLAGFEQRKTFTLSGGERQRVALARTLAPGPRLLMLDEPLSALDRELHDRLLEELGELLARARGATTTLYVTHDQQEAFALADRIVVMRAGAIAQVGTPDDVYRRPASADVARFLGFENLIAVTALEPGPGDATTVRTAIGSVALPVSGDRRAPNVVLLIRPEAGHLVDGEAAATPGVLRGQVVERSFRGAQTRLLVRPEAAPQHTLAFLVSGRAPAAGQAVALRLDADALAVIPTQAP